MNFDFREFILPRVLELTYTAWDLEPFARDCVVGLGSREIRGRKEGLEAYVDQFMSIGADPTLLPPYSLPPFKWDEDRRFLLRCELDAAFFHLYLPAEAHGDWLPAEGETPEDLALLKASFPTPRDTVAYIMDTFPIVKRKDEQKYGEYRTRRVILEIYDALGESIRTGQPYQTRLDPPPADPQCCHPPQSRSRTEES